MAFYNKSKEKVKVQLHDNCIDEYLLVEEKIIASYEFIKNSIYLTNLGIYIVEAQKVTDKKVEVKFFPVKSIKNISFEIARVIDLDISIKIVVDNNLVLGMDGYTNVPISFKVLSSQVEQAKEIVGNIKRNYLC